MSLSGQQEALLARDDEKDIPASAIYTTWRLGGSKAFVVRHALTQLSMAFVLFLFFVATVAIDYHQMRGRLTNTICPGPKPNTASLFETDCWGNRPIDLGRRTHPIVILVICMVVIAIVIELVFFFAALRRVRMAEAWWIDTFGSYTTPSIHSFEDWSEVCRVVHVNEFAVSARADFYGKLYTSVLLYDTCPNSLHRFINTSIYLYKRTGIPLRNIFPAMGGVALVAMPYMAVGMMCHFFFRNFYSVRTRGIGFVMGRRKISLSAKWQLHIPGEPPHKTEARAEEIERLGVSLLDSIPLSKSNQTLVNTVLICGGAFTALVVLLTFILGEHVLTTELMLERTVAFYTACVGIGMAVASSLQHTPASDSKRYEYVSNMGPPYTEFCHDNAIMLIRHDLPHQAFTLLAEVLSLVSTPIRLLWFMPYREIQQLADEHFISYEQETSEA